jgi:hypothetical protein
MQKRPDYILLENVKNFEISSRYLGPQGIQLSTIVLRILSWPAAT